MSSRARRVDQDAERYDWNAPLPSSDVLVSETVHRAPAHVSSEGQEGQEGQVGQAGQVGQVGQVGQGGQGGQEGSEGFEDRQQRFAALERDAFTKGYAQGERAGGEAAGKRADAMLRRLAQTVEELSSLRNDLLHRTERQVIQLSLAIAHRIVQKEVNVDRGMLLAMARVAIDRIGEHAAATIRLHPEDYAIVMAAQDGASAGDHVQVVADSVVGRGGCLVQADFGLMDVGLEAQFNEMARALLDGDAETVPVLEHVPVAHAMRAAVHA